MKKLALFSAIFLSAIFYLQAQFTLTDSLVAYYPFNGNANDASSNGHDGTVNGATLTTDRFGNPNSAYDFDSSYIDCNAPLLPASGDWSVNIWINPDILDTVNPTAIWGQYEYPVIGRILLVFDNTRGNKITSSWGSDGSGGHMFLNSDIQPQLNTWQMITLVRKDTILSIYDNGKISGSNDSLFVDIMQTHNFYIGLHHTNYLNCCSFKGKLDDARIYNRAITPDEIDSLYHLGGWSGDTTLVAFYPFNGNANDESGNEHDGTVTGAILANDRFGNPNSAYSFDGDNDYITLDSSNSFGITHSITVSAWVYFDNNGEGVILSNYNGWEFEDGDIKFKWTNWSDSSLVVALGQGNNVGVLYKSKNKFVLDDHKFHNIVFTFDESKNDGNKIELWLDDIKKNMEPFAGSHGDGNGNGSIILNNSVKLKIGGNYEDPQYVKYISGKIDELRIYNRALSFSEIDSLYHLGGWATDTTDLAVEWIAPIDPACGTVKEEAIKVRIQNRGTVSVNRYDLSYSTDGGNTFVTEAITQPLAAGESMDYTFSRKADMSEIMTYHCRAAVHAKNDLDATNDTVAIDVQNLAISFSLQTTETSCNDSTGAAGVTAITGGTPPYQYAWTSGDTGSIANSLASGIYQVTVTDANGCSTTETFSISASGGPEILTSETQNITCYGGDNGAVDITVFGGAPPYTYLWSTGATTEDITDVAAGTYDVTITDANLCSNTMNFTVTQPPQLSAVITETDASCGNSDGEATVSVSGGTPPYTYSWSGGGTSATETGLAGGIYRVTVTDASGCTATRDVTISETGAPEITLESISPAHCGVSDGAIDISVSGGTGTYIYTWSTGFTGEDLSGAAPGDYTVSVTHSDNSCTSSAAFTIPSVKPDPVPICMVTVDSVTNRNIVVWGKPANQGDITSFNIYRESSVAGEYMLVGNVKYSDESIFIDSVANPDIHSWRYRISTLDGCGNESDKSEAHKTIHLSMNLGVGNTINLAWDDYKGFAYSTYHIYRYAAPQYIAENLDNLAATGAGFNSYTDQDPPTGDVYYVVTIDAPSPCISSRKTGSHNSVRSNKKSLTLSASGIDQTRDVFNSLAIYPNPNSGIFTLKGSLKNPGDLEVRIFSATGSLVFTRKIQAINNNFQEEIVLPQGHAGIYYIELIARNGEMHRVVVIE